VNGKWALAEKREQLAGGDQVVAPEGVKEIWGRKGQGPKSGGRGGGKVEGGITTISGSSTIRRVREILKPKEKRVPDKKQTVDGTTHDGINKTTKHHPEKKPVGAKIRG